MVSEYSNWSHILGGFSALLSALMWAIAAILFTQLGKQLSARALNLGKGIIAAVCLVVLLLVSSSDFAFVLPSLELNAFWYLALSGLLGITIGDTLYFLTLQRLGAKLTLLCGTLIPVVTAISAVIIFDESISLMSAVGLLLTVSGITYVLWHKVEKENVSKVWVSGLVIAFIYVFTESGGILLTKFGLESYGSIEATLIRQVFGIAGLVFWGLAARSLFSDFSPVRKNRPLLVLFFIASFAGAFLGTWLSILALELTYTAVAVSLNSTSPLFVLPIAYWYLKEKLTMDSVIGATIAVLGVVLYFASLSQI